VTLLRKILVVSLFVLFVAFSYAALWSPVLTTLLKVHDFTGFPEWIFELLWHSITLALSTFLVAGAFLLVGLIIRRIWPATLN
jgi:hypothetical protein